MYPSALWTVIPAATPIIPIGGPTGIGAPNAGSGSCSPVYFTQADLLALFDRFYPSGYLLPLKEVGPGYELLEVFAKLCERVSLRIGEVECAVFIIYSFGGIAATGTVEFVRPTAAAGAVTVLAGTVVSTSKTGRQYRTTEDAVFGALTLSVIVQAQAVGFGWEFNVPGPIFAANGDLLPGEIDTVDFPLQDPPFGDTTITVRQVGDFTGGRPNLLDQLAGDRAIYRSLGETDASLRARARALPDTVSPDAIRRQLDFLFGQYGLTYTLIETWQIDYQTCWDAPAAAIPANPLYDPDLWAYDDPRPSPLFRGRWLDEAEYRSAIIVVVPQVGSIQQFAMAYDDTAADIAAHTTTLGRRAFSAYDIPSATLAGLLPGAYDGEDLGANTFYLAVYDLLQQIKAAGIAVIVELEGQ